MDELSLAGENHLVILDNGGLPFRYLDPEEVGLPTYSRRNRGGDAERNARIMMSILNGDNGPFRDTVLLNAGWEFLQMVKRTLSRRN